MKRVLEAGMLNEFRDRLLEEEKAQSTVEKYMHDVGVFFDYVKEENGIDKHTVIAYKEYLTAHYAAASVNSMLAALNVFLKAMGWHECTVRALKIQKEAFRERERDLTKAEYLRLLKTAKEKGKMRLYWTMQVLCATGIRVSELRYITVESLQTGSARVCSKGKQRTVLLPAALCRKLRRYVTECGITGDSIFVTRSGKPVDRSNICHDMKALCEEASICREKVFPHNLRHLFAVTYYKAKKDISHLADLLGHASINTTRIYTLVSSEEQKQQIEYLGLVV